MRRAAWAVAATIVLGGCIAAPSGPAGNTGSQAPASAAAMPLPCVEISVAGPSTAPGATPDPSLSQRAYGLIADAFNDAARAGLGRAGDPASSIDARRDAVRRLSASERCFGDRVRALAPPARAIQAQVTLLQASEAVARQLDAAAGAETAAALEAALPAVRQRYRAASEAAASFRAAIERTFFAGWQQKPPSIAVGRPIASPGELWFRNAGWSISWSGASEQGSYSAEVDNPWDAFAIDVTVHVWLVAEGGSDYAPPSTIIFGSVGPGQAAVRTEAIQVRRDTLLDAVLGDVPGAGTWYALAAEELSGR